MLTNYYFILGIPYTATIDEIRKAYRLKAKLIHPDINSGANAKQKFQLLSEAYQILIDVEKRNAYDYKWKTRYGDSFHNRYNTTQHTTGNNYYKAYTSQARYYNKSSQKIERSAIDMYLFYFLVLVGILSVVMGTAQLFYREWKGIDSLSGLVFGFWILYLLLTGWRYMAKDK